MKSFFGYTTFFLLILTYSTSSLASKERRLIVKYRKDFELQAQFSRGASPGVSKDFSRVKLKVSEESFSKKMEELKSDPQVEFVEEDILLNKTTTPNDPSYSSQWHYYNSNGGINLPAAWDETVGTAVNVAVVDTGITNHSELNSKVLPGADLISDTGFSNDGGGRDMDPSDPGDWIEPGDSCFSQTGYQNSSWHGTHVAGTIAAKTNNSVGVSGVNWNARILPVRVLGKCGGYSSDIADGIRWAAGVSVSGLSTNSNPAKVINLSLGGSGSCGQDMQSAINQAKSRGAIIVVAAGNSSQNIDVSQFTPANCKGVIVVAASNINGQLASYSNYGTRVDVTAPGGNNFNPVLSTFNTGSRGPGSETYSSQSGTSMAAPHVSGVASLIFSVNPELYPDQVEQILKDNTRLVFGCSNGCGAGLIDAQAAVVDAMTITPDPSFTSQEPVVNDRSELGSGDQIYQIDSSSGGSCGTISFDDKGGPGNGPLSMTLMAMLSFLALGFARKTKRTNY